MADRKPIERLEDAVQQACEGIYREFKGYWPSRSERARIAVALLEQYRRPSDQFGRTHCMKGIPCGRRVDGFIVVTYVDGKTVRIGFCEPHAREVLRSPTRNLRSIAEECWEPLTTASTEAERAH